MEHQSDSMKHGQANSYIAEIQEKIANLISTDDPSLRYITLRGIFRGLSVSMERHERHALLMYMADTLVGDSAPVRATDGMSMANRLECAARRRSL